jgi:hypothetical protein
MDVHKSTADFAADFGLKPDEYALILGGSAANRTSLNWACSA